MDDTAQPAQEPYALRLPGDEATRKAGQNLREWAGDERGRGRRLIDRLLDRDVRDPKLAGAWGEEVVGKALERLGPDWTVVHGVRVGPRADVDHLVVAPPGVFSLNTKMLRPDAKIEVTPRRLLVDGYSRDYYPKAVKEAERVAARMSAAFRAPVAVQPVLVLNGVDRKRLTVKAQPEDVAVVLRQDLLAWLTRKPATLDHHSVRRLADTARRPGTWDPKRTMEVLDRQPAQQTPPPDPTPPEATVTEWKRYGHHRLYVNDATGKRLGWRDEKTGQVACEAPSAGTEVHAALARWDQQGE